MGEKHTVQTSLYHLFTDHQISQELHAMSDWLDAHPEVLDWVEADICPVPVKDCGRKGLPVESVLRCAILKQFRQVSDEELAFYLMDSYSYQAFTRLPMGILPKKAVLQQTISRITEVTWEKINQVLLGSAQSDGLEQGQVIRMDSTATEATIHEPSDSHLLWDSVRVLVRLFNQAQEIPGAPA